MMIGPQKKTKAMRVMNDTGSRILDMDFQDLLADANYKSLTVSREEKNNFDSGFSVTHCVWKMKIPGGTGMSGCVYDVEIHFSRHHPFEPPVVLVPRTTVNICNPSH